MRQVHNDARQKARFCGAHQETDDIKLAGGVDEGHQQRHQSPGNHDARDPAASAPSFNDQRTGDFQQEVTKEEDPRPQPNHALAETKVIGHLECRRTYVHAIEKGDHVEQEQEGQEPACDAMPGAPGDLGLGVGSHDGLGTRVVRDRRHSRNVANFEV